MIEETYFNRAFYENLKKQLIDNGKEILQNQNEYKEIHFLNDIINVIFWLDVEVINTIFPSLVERLFTKKDHIYDFIYIIFKNRKISPLSLNGFSSNIKNQLEKIKNALTEETIRTVEYFVIFLQDRHRKAMEYAYTNKSKIEAVFHKNYHEFFPKFENLKTELQLSPSNLSKSINLWTGVKDIITHSINDLQIIQKFTGISRDNVDFFNLKLTNLRNYIIHVDSSLEASKNPIKSTFFNEIPNIISSIKDRFEIITVNLKSIIRQCEDKYDFNSIGIDYQPIIPQDKCDVFGEESEIYSCINNIFDNIFLHSKCHMFQLNVNFTDDGYIVANFYDDGIGGDFNWGQGLINTSAYVKKYCGEFKINGRHNSEWYKTSAIIKLINVSKKNYQS